MRDSYRHSGCTFRSFAVLVTLGVIVSACASTGPTLPSRIEPTLMSTTFPDEQIEPAKSREPLLVDLSFDSMPHLGKEAGLTFSVTPAIQASETQIRFVLPRGFQLIAGELLWKGTVDKDQTLKRRITVRIIETGLWKIIASATIIVEGGTFGQDAVLFVQVDEHNSVVTKQSPVGATIEDTAEQVK